MFPSASFPPVAGALLKPGPDNGPPVDIISLMSDVCQPTSSENILLVIRPATPQTVGVAVINVGVYESPV